MDMFAMVRAGSAYLLSDHFGRRGLFAASAMGFALGAAVMAASSSFEILILGRAMVGLCVRFGLAVDPVYISEVSPPDRRGELVAWSEISLNLGVVSGFASGLVLYPLPDVWIGISLALPNFGAIVHARHIPESSRWLVQKGRLEEATAILRTIYPPDSNVGLVIYDIEQSIQQDEEADKALGWVFL